MHTRAPASGAFLCVYYVNGFHFQARKRDRATHTEREREIENMSTAGGVDSDRYFQVHRRYDTVFCRKEMFIEQAETLRELLPPAKHRFMGNHSDCKLHPIVQAPTARQRTPHLRYQGGATSSDCVARYPVEFNCRCGHAGRMVAVTWDVPAAEGADAIRSCQRAEHQQDAYASHSYLYGRQARARSSLLSM